MDSAGKTAVPSGVISRYGSSPVPPAGKAGGPTGVFSGYGSPPAPPRRDPPRLGGTDGECGGARRPERVVRLVLDPGGLPPPHGPLHVGLCGRVRQRHEPPRRAAQEV